MGNQTLDTSKVIIGGFTLSITTRSAGDEPDVLEELTFRTIGAWMKLVSKIEQREFELNEDEQGSVESRYETFRQVTEPTFKLAEAWGDARVTIWDSDRGTRVAGFHLNSDDDFQTALYTWKAHQMGIKRAQEFFKTPERQAETSQPSNGEKPATPKGNGRPTPAPAPQAATEGVVMATRAPSSTPQYQPGQKVGFIVTEIEAGTNAGSPIYKMWTGLGSKYPTVTIYETDKNGETRKDFKTIQEAIDMLGFTLKKPKVQGAWKLVCEVSHYDKEGKTKEYFNPVSLTPVQ